jgi:putative PIN family toxin of toxin-antitoxin system
MSFWQLIKGQNLKNIFQILHYIDQQAEFIQIKSEIVGCRDEKDNFLLSLAVDGKADFLITGDRDLLELKQIETSRIVTLTRFLEII